MQIKLYSIRETTVWHVNGKLIWQSISPISIKGNRIDSTNYKIIDTVGFLGEILDQTIENMVCGLQAWHQEAVMSRKQLGFPEHPSCRPSTIPLVVSVAPKTQQRWHIRISVRQLCRILPLNRLMNKIEVVRRRAHWLVWKQALQSDETHQSDVKLQMVSKRHATHWAQHFQKKT